MNYKANPARYDTMPYRRCGKSGLKLPALCLGLWHNFGREASPENCRKMLLDSFDAGITHFDLANNYGPPAGSAEETFGRVLKSDLAPYRDELLISTKSGYYMWPGPYGEWGSRKQLMASLDQSLARMGLDYVDIFYHHRPDPDTPLEETMGALAHMVKSGKALYVGISNYGAAATREAVALLGSMGVHCLVHQLRYSMLARENEEVLAVLRELGVGSVAFSPLAQGLLTGKYIGGVPAGSRAAGPSPFLKQGTISPGDVEKSRRLLAVAQARGQSLAQLALAWVLREKGGATAVILGASKPAQIAENLHAAHSPAFTQAELDDIEAILASE